MNFGFIPTGKKQIRYQEYRYYLPLYLLSMLTKTVLNALLKIHCFPVMSNEKMNAYLKEIADLCKINF
jgi:hypothetical protein